MLLLAATTACGNDSASDDPAPTDSTSASGPLRIMAGTGGVSLQAPPGEVPWAASYGGLILCVDQPSAVAEISQIRFESSPRPLAIKSWFRVVPPAAKRHGDPLDEKWSPFGALVGHQPRYEHGFFAAGKFTQKLPMRIDEQCPAAPSRTAGYIDLVTEMKVGSEGADVKSTSVEYSSDGHDYSVTTTWQNVACGSRVGHTWCNGAR
jgi:hypothetical protein